MKDQPLVSIVVSVYNGEQGMGEILSSLEAQTYPHIEIVVVDDGSTDRTADIVREHASRDPRIRIVQHQKNLRLAAGRNTGIANSRGEIICFTDDDCLADPRWVEELAKVYEARPEVDGVGGRIEPYRAETVFEKYASFGKNRVYGHTPILGFGGRTLLYLKKFFGWRPVALKDGDPIESIMGMNASYRREVLMRIGGFDPTMVKGEDWDANIRALRIARAGAPFDPTLSRGVDWELNIRLLKQQPVFVYCERAVIYHRHRQGFGAFVRHLYSYGKAYTDVAKRHPFIVLLPYPGPFLFVAGLLFGVVWHPAFLILAAFYLKDTPYVVPEAWKRRDPAFLLFPLIDVVRELSYNIGLFARILSR